MVDPGELDTEPFRLIYCLTQKSLPENTTDHADQTVLFSHRKFVAPEDVKECKAFLDNIEQPNTEKKVKVEVGSHNIIISVT